MARADSSDGEIQLRAFRLATAPMDSTATIFARDAEGWQSQVWPQYVLRKDESGGGRFAAAGKRITEGRCPIYRTPPSFTENPREGLAAACQSPGVLCSPHQLHKAGGGRVLRNVIPLRRNLLVPDLTSPARIKAGFES